MPQGYDVKTGELVSSRTWKGLISGGAVARVTNITGAIFGGHWGVERDERLAQFAIETGDVDKALEKTSEYGTTATRQGSDIHKIAELIYRGEWSDGLIFENLSEEQVKRISEELTKVYNHDIYDCKYKVVATEETVVNSLAGYAGTVDLQLSTPTGERIIRDWKSKDVKPLKDGSRKFRASMLDKSYLPQLASYAAAIYECEDGCFLPDNVTLQTGIIDRNTGWTHVHTYTKDERDEAIEDFIAYHDSFYRSIGCTKELELLLDKQD